MNNSKGFSLIELLLVVTIVAVIAVISVPNFIRGLQSAENGSANATMKVMMSAQTSFFSTNGRYGRLSELNSLHQNSIGIEVGNQLIRGKFSYEMIPANPTDDQLKSGFAIKATRPAGAASLPYVVEINERGYTTPIFP